MSTPVTPIAQIGGPGTNPAFASMTWPEVLRLKANGPTLLKHGYKRVQFKNPGGHWDKFKELGDSRAMWPQQFTWAKEAKRPWAKDEHLLETTRIAVDEFGIEHIVWYVGGRVVLPDPLRDGRKHFAPFIATAKVPGVQIELCFDTDSWFGEHKSGTPQFMLALEHNRELRDQGIHISIEARPALGNHFWIDDLNATLSLASTEAIKGYAARNNEAWMYGEIRRDPGTNSAAAHASIKTYTDTYGPNKTRITPIVRRFDLSSAANVLPSEAEYAAAEERN